MSKPTLIPKELMKKRVKNNKELKVAKIDSECREKIPTDYTVKKQKKYEPHYRQIKTTDRDNPFNIPNRMRMFSKATPKKTKPELKPEDDPVRTLCDVHNEFYKVIVGRPLRHANDINVYIMKNMRNIVLYKTDAGFMKEEIQRINHHFRNETEEYEKISTLCSNSNNNYIRFLRESFAIAKQAQNNAAKVADKLDIASDQLEEYSLKYVKLRNRIGVIVSRYELLSKYKKFLTLMAPDQWQRDHGDLSNITVDQIYQKLTSNMDLKSEPSVVCQIVSQECSQPRIFFSQPRDLMSIFDNLGRQGNDYLDVVNKTSGMLTELRQHQNVFKTGIKRLCEEMQYDVNNYKKNVYFMEMKEIHYKNAFFKILLNDFQRFGDYENIKLQTCVQYTYFNIFGGQKESDDDTITMMRNLENLYMKLSLKIDKLDLAVVNETEKELFAKDIKMMQNAYKARRELQLCDILRKSLYTSFEPSRRTKSAK